ncbi:MAG: EF-hand domain-containing protein [Kofleriaceae bacterium]
MKLAMVLCLVLAGACKTDGAEQAAPSSSSGDTVAAPAESGAKPRSGKIQLPPRLPSNGSEATDRQMPSLESGDMTDEERMERRAARQERREERRKERMEKLDTDKDGQISPEEMQAGRKQRAEDMRSRFDANGDGKLTVDELSEGRMGRRLDPATVDSNKDGDISADELSAGMEQMRERFRGMRGARGQRWGQGSNAGSADQP